MNLRELKEIVDKVYSITPCPELIDVIVKKEGEDTEILLKLHGV